MKIDILIPIHNHAALTIACIDDYKHLDKDKHTITIFDNGSTDNSYQKILNKIDNEKLTNINIIKSKKNLGFAKACNNMYDQTDGDIIIFSNNDVRVHASALSNWTDIIEKNLTSNKLISPTAGMIDSNCNFQYETQDPNKDWNYLSGWLLCGYEDTFDMFCDEKHLDENPFTEAMGTYFEDTWMSMRAKKMGIDMQLVKVPIQHLGKQTSKNMNLGDIYMRSKNIFKQKIKKENIIIS